MAITHQHLGGILFEQFPALTPFEDYLVRDEGDGPFLEFWNPTNPPEPTQADVDGWAASYNPVMTPRKKIIARLKRDPEFRALLLAYRDSNGLTNQQVLQRLEQRYDEQVG